MSLPRDAIESLSGAPLPSWASRSPLRAVRGAPLRSRARATGVARAYRRRRECKPAPVSVERRPRRVRRRPHKTLLLLCVARRAGAPSAMRQLGELLQETPALHPTSAGSAISRTVLSFRAKGAIVPAGCAAPSAALPLARTSRCARKRGPLVVRTSRASSLNFVSASRSRACRRRTASQGAARRRFLSGGWGRACDAAPRGPWSPGDRRTRMRGA